MSPNYPIIDIHTHLRNDIPRHTKIARENGISAVVYMANCDPPLDNLKEIKKSLKSKRYCLAFPVSAITKNLKGKELVDRDKIMPFVVGFSDDGRYLENLDLLEEALNKKILILAHCSPPYEVSIRNPESETTYISRYLKVLKRTKGRIHIQHISKKESIKLIRKAKKQGLNITCETAPHYFTYTNKDLTVKVNPPLGTKRDLIAIKEGLADGTIDVISSDYAPEPRKTGIAGFSSFFSLSYGLVREGVLSERQLKQKLYLNPMRIIRQKECFQLNAYENLSKRV